MARNYVMTPKRRAALRKAQRASALKRRKNKKPLTSQQKIRRQRIIAAGSVAAIYGGVGALTAYNHYQTVKVNEMLYDIKSGRSTQGKSYSKVYGRHVKSRTKYRAKRSVRTATMPIRSTRQFGQGFKQGYTGARQTRKRTAYNMRTAGVGSTRVYGHRIQPKSLPVGRGTNQKRPRGFR
jgi:hypothetical protein